MRENVGIAPLLEVIGQLVYRPLYLGEIVHGPHWLGKLKYIADK
jgi:hypothetical protein